MASTDWKLEYGILAPHWHAIRQVATDRQCILAIRSGKAAALRWIEMNFPPKPLELKIKTDPDLGLLKIKLRSARERREVAMSGHWVLDICPSTGQLAAMDLSALLRDPPEKEPQVAASSFLFLQHRLACPGIVIDRRTLKPFTSDYDLGAVIFVGDKRRGKTYLGSVDGGGEGDGVPQGRLQTVTGSTPAGPRPKAPTKKDLKAKTGPEGKPINWSNPWVEDVVADLNQALGSVRFVHGPVGNFSGSWAIGREDVLVFFPGGNVEVVSNTSWVVGRRKLREMLSRFT